MPAGYTHYQFSEDVLTCLPDHHLKQILIQHKELFQIGTHGPDIFFYHRFYDFHDRVNRLGKAMHNEPARDFFETSLHVIQDDSQLAYILGFLCHFILDSQMHYYVKKIMKEADMSHFEVEAEYDRYLLKRKKLDPVNSYIYSHVQINEHIVCTIQSFFPQLTYLEVQKSLESLKFVDKVLHAPSYFKRGLLYTLFHITFHFQQLQGLVINYHHNIKMEKYYDLFNHSYQDALNEALIYLPLYYKHLNNKEALPATFDQTYK